VLVERGAGGCEELSHVFERESRRGFGGFVDQAVISALVCFVERLSTEAALRLRSG
jgi:hypothetical protein